METVTHIEQVLISCLKDLAGGDAPNEIEDGMNVLKNWGLESDDGMDLALDLELRLGIEIPERENPLVKEDSAGRKRARSFREVVAYLARFMSSQLVR
jgi:acyl carrier protein